MCEARGKEIIGFYVRFKKVGSEEYMSFHVDNGSDRVESCWGIWMKQIYIFIHSLQGSSFSFSWGTPGEEHC